MAIQTTLQMRKNSAFEELPESEKNALAYAMGKYAEWKGLKEAESAKGQNRFERLHGRALLKAFFPRLFCKSKKGFCIPA